MTFTATGTAGAATQIAVNAGDGQTATVGTAVATTPSVIVKDVGNNPVSGVTVTFAVATGGGSGTGLSATTDASGIATIGSWTLGTTAGSNTLTATSGTLTGSPVTFTVTGTAGAATQIAVNAGNGQTATVGTAVATTPSVIVKDVGNNPVSGVTVTFAVATGGGSGTGLSATTDASGIATIGSWTLGATAGSNTLTATSGTLTGSPVTFTATGTAGAATQIAVNAGDGQSATAGTAVATTPSVIVKDVGNNPVSGVTVTFAVATGGGSGTGLSATTDASGIATIGSWTLGTTAGSNTLTATSGTLTGSPVTFTATGTAGIAYYLTAAGAGAAQTAANWNTIADGSGTQAPNFTTAGSIFNIPLGINGVVSGNWTFGNSGNAAAMTLTINGLLSINSGYTLTLSQKNSGTNSMTVNGTLIFSDASANQLAGTSSGSGKVANNTFVLTGGAMLQTANANGIVNTTTSSINSSTITTTLNVAANYEFNGTAQTTTGLPATVNNLTLSGSDTKTLTAITNINGSFTISGTASTTATAALTIGGDVTLGSGSSFTAGSYTHNVGGDWTNNGATFTSTGSTINFNGSGTNTIGGSSATTFNNLFIDKSSGSITLGADVNIIGILKATSGTLASGGHLTLVSSASQTALIDGSGTGEVLGNVTVQRYLPSAFGYKYISSPFQSVSVSAFTDVNLSASFPNFYKYDEDSHRDSAGVAIYQSGWVKYLAGTLSPMSGYAANFGPDTQAKTISITGAVSNGPMSVTLYNSNRKYTNGFNLVGNPYPSPIDWEAPSGWIKTNMDAAIYFFNASTPGGNAAANDSLQYQGTYSSYVAGIGSGSLDRYIPSMQGFFVRVSNTGAGEITFNNGIRTNDLNPAYKSVAVDYRPIFRFSAAFDQLNSIPDPYVIYLDDQATMRFDSELDALKLMNTDSRVPNLYEISNNPNRLSISGIPYPVDSLTTIPIGIKTLKEGWINFQANDITKLPADYTIFLVDNFSHMRQDLRVNPKYRFYLKAGETNQRFALVLALIDPNKHPNPVEPTKLFTLSRLGETLLIQTNLSTDAQGELLIFNILGQQMMNETVSGNQTYEVGSGWKSGVYLITLISGKSKYSEKVFIRRQ